MTTRRRLAVLSLGLAICGWSEGAPLSPAITAAPLPPATTTAPRRVRIPLDFQENRGQARAACRFLSSAGDYELCLQTNAIELTGSPRTGEGASRSDAGADTVRLTFHGAHAGSLAGVERLTGTANFLAGPDPAAWITGVPTFRRVQRQSLYPGVDLVLYGNERDVEFDLVVAPLADPSVVRIGVDGAVPRIENGRIVLATRGGTFELRPPRVYQDVGRSRRAVAARYELAANGDIGFRLASFDRGHPLVIDPVIAFATYLGGPDSDIPSDVAVDSSGNSYIVSDVPRANSDVLVTKLDPTGLHVLYSTYIGGTLGESVAAVAVDAEGHAFVTGHTQSTNFPVVDALQPTLAGVQSAFVSKLSLDGASLEFSTYFGHGFASLTHAIAVDSQQNVWIGGNGEAPTKSSLFGTGPFVAKISGSGAVLHFSTKIGGSGISVVRGLAVDAAGDAYVVGSTNAVDLPTQNAYQPASAGGSDGFVMKLSSETTLDPLLLDAFDTENMGAPGAAVAELSAWHILDGSIDLVTAGDGLAATTPAPGGGARIERRAAVTLSPGESIFASANVAAYRLELDVIGPPGPAPGELTVTIGSVFAETFPIPGHGATARFTRDFIVPVETAAAAIVEWPAGNHQPALDRIQLSRIRETPVLAYSTYVGGSGSDLAYSVKAEPSGAVHVAGVTSSPNFPVLNAYQNARLGATDAFVVRLDPAGNPTYSTLLGGTGDEDIPSVAVDPDGNTLVTGQTSSADFPTLDALQPSYAGGWDGFLTKILLDGSLGYSTYIGGTEIDWPSGIAVDHDGSAYVVMQTTSSDHVTVNATQPLHGGSNDAYVVKVADTAQLRAFGLSQTRGGNNGQVTTRILGANFSPGPVTVKLVGLGPDIVAHSAIAVDAGTITATFDLFGAPAGVRDVVVTFADGRSVTLNSAFTVESGGEPHVWVDVIGRPSARRNVPTTYYVVVGNQGTVDAPGVGIKVTVPAGVTIQPDFPMGTSPGSVGAPAVIARGADQIVPLLLPVVPAGGTITLPFTVAASAPSFNIGVEVEQWLLNSPSRRIVLAAPDVFQCVLGGFAAGLSVVSLPTTGARALALGLLDRYFSAVNAVTDGNNHPLSLVDEWASVIADLTPLGNNARFVLATAAFEAMPAITACLNVLDRLREPFSVTTFGAIDPNEKVGPPGAGPQGYITSQQPLRYAVHFENLATATAPAATVVVEDRLDVTRFDPATVDFGAIAIGSRVITPPSGTSFDADVDLRPQQDLIARVRAAANALTGVVRLEITSIDPLTGQPPLDPLAGFLPPNTDGREGTGSMLFTVRLRPSLPAGAQISNQASITFDANAPIETNLWVNTLDETPPTSEVLPLAPEQGSAGVTVAWTGSDSGSQIRDFSIWVSEDDGPYTLWLLATEATSGVFPGQFGHRYSFYSIARDLAGNVEASPASGDTSTLVIDRTAPIVTCGATDPAWHAANVVVTCEASDSGSGLARIEDQLFQLATSVSVGSETTLAMTGSHEVCDVSGNCVTAGPLGPIRVDRAAPAISTSAVASPIVLNQIVTVTYSCVDGGSGVASCVGTRPSGASIPTSSAGTSQFVVSAADNVGNAASSSTSYVVAYDVCADYDQEKAHRSGSTIPIRIRLCDAGGQNVSSASIPVVATSVTRIGDDVSTEIADAGNANPDANFRYTDGQYVFNLRLNGYATGVYALTFTAGEDPTAHVVRFHVK